MPNKINNNIKVLYAIKPEKGDIYHSGYDYNDNNDNNDNELYILCEFFYKETLYVLISLRTGHFWHTPSPSIKDAVRDAIFVGRDMTITLS